MLIDRLNKYAEGDVYPMHMPGHKRNTDLLRSDLPYNIDITEIYGFDDLHNPNGILLEMSERAAALYGSRAAFPLVNGSTVGILAAIGALALRGDKILITSNCHRSVQNAASLFGLEPVCITPETDEASGVLRSVDPAAIEAALKKDRNIRLVAVTSPSYEGIISDIGSIAEVAHSYDIPLFVDSAHGAHLDFSARFHGGAILAGADVVVISLHKTLPALTQCSLLHVCTGRANADAIRRMLSVLQTSSPSYVLMSSIDYCLHLLEADKDRLFAEYGQRLDSFSRDIESLKRLNVLCHGSDLSDHGFYAFDPGKLVILTRNTSLSGILLADILREDFSIELEMSRADYAVAMTSVCDTTAGFSRLAVALNSIDSSMTAGAGF